MGCCVSSDSSNRSSSSSSAQPPRSSISRDRAPPPLPLEEETVKEVLSETPKWNNPTTLLPKFEAQDSPQKPKGFDNFHKEKKFDKDKLGMVNAINKGEEISEVSEVCSLSESVSTATFTEDESRQKVNRSPARMLKNRSFSGEFAGKRDRAAVGKSPARRSEQSPAKGNGGSVKVVQSRDQMGTGVTRNQPRRRDPGENSGRRSRSPATRTDAGAVRSVVGRSPSARRGTNQSPARVRTASPAPESGGRKMESPNTEGKWPSANESLENPLVSLECFIFL